MCGIVGAVSRAPVDTALMEQMRDRTDASLRSLPEHLRPPEPADSAYPVEISARLRPVQ